MPNPKLDFYKFCGKVDRRHQPDEGDYNNPLVRENLLSRDGHLISPAGTETAITGFTDIVTWSARYHTLETGIISPKTFAYTQDGKLWAVNENNGTATLLLGILNPKAYPKSWLFKTSNQNKLYLVDGRDLYEYDGNNNNQFTKIDTLDANGDTINPIDLIEHLDRLILISLTDLFVSANLQPSVFNDASDSLQAIVGSGKGKNLALGKIGRYLYVFNTEGIYVLYGDTISAVASTFEIVLVEERQIIAAGSAKKVEKSIIFLAAFDKNIELWSFDGSNSKMISYVERLTDFINPNPEMLAKAASCYYNNYYMISVVETGMTYNNLELWYDTLEDKIEFVRGRNVSCYMVTDPTIEGCYQLLGRSDASKMMWADRGHNFDGIPITKKLKSRDITPANGEVVRFIGFYPKIEPVGNINVYFRYLLDGRLSDLDHTADFIQNLKGETKALGFIEIDNQNQFLDRVKPKINYAKGSAVSIEVFDNTKDLEFKMCDFGVEYIYKGRRKSKITGA